MSIELSGRNRTRFAADIKMHRDGFNHNDLDYSKQVLKVSLNTYKKCIQPDDKEPLALKRQTFTSIFTNTGLDPKSYGLSISVPRVASPYGGYLQSEYRDLCGRYFFYRPSFLTAKNITRSVLEINANDGLECLSFTERHRYIPEAGDIQELQYRGNIYINPERSIFSLPSFSEGNVRLTALQLDRRGEKTKVKWRGAQLTFGSPRTILQPITTCVYAEGPIPDTKTSWKDLCGTFKPGEAEYDALSANLSQVEQHVTVNTGLLRLKL